MTNVNIKILLNGIGLDIPKYATELSAGVDLRAAVENDVILQPGKFELIPTGIAIELSQGFEAQVRPRSGLAVKNGITVLNTPGTIDADYRGEIKVCLINFSEKDFIIKRGERIAQMVISKFERVNWQIVEDLSDTERNDGGFGSTGSN